MNKRRRGLVTHLLDSNVQNLENKPTRLGKKKSIKVVELKKQNKRDSSSNEITSFLLDASDSLKPNVPVLMNGHGDLGQPGRRCRQGPGGTWYLSWIISLHEEGGGAPIKTCSLLRMKRSLGSGR